MINFSIWVFWAFFMGGFGFIPQITSDNPATLAPGSQSAAALPDASVYHASVLRCCMPVIGSCSSSSGASPNPPLRERGCWHTHENCMHAKQIIIIFYMFFFYYLLYIFGIVFNCIMQNNNYCLPGQCFFI